MLWSQAVLGPPESRTHLLGWGLLGQSFTAFILPHNCLEGGLPLRQHNELASHLHFPHSSLLFFLCLFTQQPSSERPLCAGHSAWTLCQAPGTLVLGADPPLVSWMKRCPLWGSPGRGPPGPDLEGGG